jgi:hypothetical protein
MSDSETGQLSMKVNLSKILIKAKEIQMFKPSWNSLIVPESAQPQVEIILPTHKIGEIQLSQMSIGNKVSPLREEDQIKLSAVDPLKTPPQDIENQLAIQDEEQIRFVHA